MMIPLSNECKYLPTYTSRFQLDKFTTITKVSITTHPHYLFGTDVRVLVSLFVR